MTRKLALFLSLLFPVLASAAWTTNGPFGGNVPTVVSAPSQPRTLYAGGPAGIARSDDGGITWRQIAPGVTGVTTIAVNPVDPDVLVAGGSAGVTRIDRNGAQVVAPAGTGVSRVYYDPNDPNVVYYGSHCGPIFKGDPQTEWHEVAGIYKSNDGGLTFARANTGLEGFALCIEELAFDPKFSGFLYTSAIFSEGGQSRTIDAAQTWDRTPAPVPARTVVAHPVYPTVRYGITSHFRNYVLTSNDNGFTWTIAHEFPQNGITIPTALQIDPATARLYLGTSNGAFRSGDGGRTWAQITPLPSNAPISALVWVAEDQALVAATPQGVYRSVFPFASWTQGELHDAATSIDTIAIDPTNPSVIYATTYDRYETMRLGRVFRSTDHGAHWEALSSEPSDRGLITVDGGGNVYAAARYGRGVWRLRAGSSTWERLASTIDVYDIAADPKRAGVVWLASQQALFRSGDGGVTWTQLADGFSRELAIGGDTVYWAASDRTLRLTPDGSSSTTLPPNAIAAPTAMAVAPSNGSVLYTVVNSLPSGQRFVARSTDGGATWAYTPMPGPNDFAAGLAVDPRDPNRVWLATANFGMFLSTDGGASFVPVTENLPTTTTAVAVDETSAFAGTLDRGVWQRANE